MNKLDLLDIVLEVSQSKSVSDSSEESSDWESPDDGTINLLINLFFSFVIAFEENWSIEDK